MPVSVPPKSTSSSPALSAPIAPTARKHSPILGDPSYNYTHTYGYNFGYIANGLSLIDEKQRLSSLPSIASSTLSTASSIPSLPNLSTSSTNPAPSTTSTKVSLSFPPTPGSSTTAPLLKAASSIHPFSPHYSAYIELVTSGGLSKVQEHRDTERKRKPKKKAAPLKSQNTTEAKGHSPPPHQLLEAVHIASSPKRKAHFEDETSAMEVGDHIMEEDAMDYFSLPKTKAKKVRLSKDMQIRERPVVSSPPLEDPPSSSSGSASTSELFSSALGLSTTGTWAATPSLVFTPGSASIGHGGSGSTTRTSSPPDSPDLISTSIDEGFPGEEGNHPSANVSKSFTNRSPSPTDSMNAFGSMSGGMISLDLLDRPKSPGVFTQARQARKGKDDKHNVKEPRPRGLWKARANGPRAPLPSILNMNAGEKGKSKGTGAFTDTRTPHSTLQPYTPTPTATTFSSASTSRLGSSSIGSGIESANRRESRFGETGYCSSSCSSYSSDEMGEVAANLKRRRIKKTASGKGGESGTGYEDDGSLSSTDCPSSNATSPSTLQKRRRAGDVPGGIDGDHHRRHQDDQRQRQQHDQSRKTLLSPSTTSTRIMATMTGTSSTSVQALNDAIPQNEDLADATKYFTRSKIMDTTSLARTQFSDKYTNTSPRTKPPPPPEVTYRDWEDLKEVWARCLEVIDSEEPEEILPLLRGIIHECGRFLQAYEDPSVLILAPPPEQTSSKVDSGVGTDFATPAKGSMPPPPPRTLPPTKPPPFVHPKDLPTAFHTLLGTALFFFGNLIGEAPNLALEGEPTSKVFYHLYALDVFEMGENLPARTGIHRDVPSNSQGNKVAHCQDDCCIPGSKEDWRLSTTWGRALISLADELLEREKICEEWLAQNPQPSPPAREENGDGYFGYGRPTYFGQGGSTASTPFRPNPASFLSEDFISSGGFISEGYFGGIGGRAMGLRVDGMGGLTVAHPGGITPGYCSPQEGLHLPSALYPISSLGLHQADVNATPKSPQREVPADRNAASPRVSSPFRTMTIGESSGPSVGTSRSAFANGLPSPTETVSTPSLPPSSLEDPRRHWQKDSPFVVIWSRLPPVTRRMVLGGTHVNGANPLPSPALPTPPEPSTFTLSWWNTDDSHLDLEGNGRYPSAMSWDEDAANAKSPSQKPKNKKNPGASVDEMMGLAVDHLSRGLFHMPRAGQPRGLGGVGGIAGGPVDLANGRSTKSSNSHSHHRHHHHHRHRHSNRAESEGIMTVGGVQPFSRAAHLLTIAMEVLMLSEKLPSPQSRYRWASHADSIFEQMRLEESPGIIKPPRRDDGMDVDIDLATGHISGDPDNKHRLSKKKSFSRTRYDNPLDAPLHSLSQNPHASGPGSLDSNRNEVILQARGRCSLIIGSAIAEDKIETYLEELDDDQLSSSGGMTATTEAARTRRAEVIKLLRGEDAEEARAKLRESVDFLERARSLWREGVSVRRKERERTKQKIEGDRKARRDASVAMQEPTRTKRRSPVLSPPPRRRGIAALAAENKKKRRERATKGSGIAVEDDAMPVDADVEMGDMAVDVVSTSPSPLTEGFEEEDLMALKSIAAEEQEEQGEEKEYARLIAEAVVTLANILLVAEEGDEELGLTPSSDGDEVGSEKEREELYTKAKEEMRRAGLEEIDRMI